MFSIGLTGGIGSGKTTVADLFAAHGVPVIDTDLIAHRITAPGGVAMPLIASRVRRRSSSPPTARWTARRCANAFSPMAPPRRSSKRSRIR